MLGSLEIKLETHLKRAIEVCPSLGAKRAPQ